MNISFQKSLNVCSSKIFSVGAQINLTNFTMFMSVQFNLPFLWNSEDFLPYEKQATKYVHTIRWLCSLPPTSIILKSVRLVGKVRWAQMISVTYDYIFTEKTFNCITIENAPETYKCFHVSLVIFPILLHAGMYWQILVELETIKFRENMFRFP
jgi:hypothetical protein